MKNHLVEKVENHAVLVEIAKNPVVEVETVMNDGLLEIKLVKESVLEVEVSNTESVIAVHAENHVAEVEVETDAIEVEVGAEVEIDRPQEQGVSGDFLKFQVRNREISKMKICL